MKQTLYAATVLTALCLVVGCSKKQSEPAPDQSKSADIAHRTKTALELSQPGKATVNSLPVLIAGLSDRNLNIRYLSAAAIKNLGPQAADAVPALIQSLNTFPGGKPELEGPERYFPDARAVSAEALQAIGPAAKAAIPALQNTAAKDPDESVRASAQAALKALQ